MLCARRIVRHRGKMAAAKLHPGRQCESQLRQLRRYAADGKNPCGIGAGWRLRSFIREDNANPNRGSCADTLPTAKTRAASGRDGGCEASSGKTMRIPTAAAAQTRCRRQKPVRHRGGMAAAKLHPGRQCESQPRQLRRHAADGKNPCGIGAGWRLRSFIREDNAPQRRSFNTVARCRAGRNDSAGGHGRPAHRPEADGRPNRKRALTERRQTT